MEEKAPVKKVFKKAPRKKVCAFCQEKLEAIDYKDVNRLKKFITEGGKILPRRMSGTCAAHQRLLSTAIIYHGIYNILVQSEYSVVGALLPIATYIPFLIWRLNIKYKKAKK